MVLPSSADAKSEKEIKFLRVHLLTERTLEQVGFQFDLAYMFFLTTELPSSKSPFFEPWWESHIFISKWSGSLRGKFWPQTLVQENVSFPAASPVLTASSSLSSSGPHTALPDSLSGGCVPAVPGWFELGTPHPAPGWVPDCGGQYGAFTT